MQHVMNMLLLGCCGGALRTCVITALFGPPLCAREIVYGNMEQASDMCEIVRCCMHTCVPALPIHVCCHLLAMMFITASAVGWAGFPHQ